MVAELFLSWAIGQCLSTTLGLARKAFGRTDQEQVLDRVVERIRSELADTPEAGRLVEAVRGRLADRRLSDGPLRTALAEQLEPVRDVSFEREDGTRETGRQLLSRLGVDSHRLVEITESALEEAVRAVAAQQADLPTRVLLADVEHMRERIDGLAAPSPSPAATDTLISAPPTMVGRREELHELAALTDQANTVVVSAVHGMGGIGKTALVRAFAERVRDRYADGRYEIDLHGFTPGQRPRQLDVVLAELLRQVGVGVQPPSSVAEMSARWRDWLSDREVLLVIDNAHSVDQVRPLLPGAASGCLVLVTSRNRLDGLDVSHRLSLDTLPEADSIALLTELAGRADDAGFAEIAELCGCLPLALCAVGPVLRTTSSADLAEVIRTSPHYLEGERMVRTAFAVSYQYLDAERQRLLRWLAFHPGPDFDAGSASAIWNLPKPVVAVCLDSLVKHGLLLAIGAGRFAFHDLFVGYARALADIHDQTERTAARERLLEHLLTDLQSAVDDQDPTLGRDAELQAAIVEAFDTRWSKAALLAAEAARHGIRSARRSIGDVARVLREALLEDDRLIAEAEERRIGDET